MSKHFNPFAGGWEKPSGGGATPADGSTITGPLYKEVLNYSWTASATGATQQLECVFASGIGSNMTQYNYPGCMFVTAQGWADGVVASNGASQLESLNPTLAAAVKAGTKCAVIPTAQGNASTDNIHELALGSSVTLIGYMRFYFDGALEWGMRIEGENDYAAGLGQIPFNSWPPRYNTPNALFAGEFSSSIY